MVLIHSLKIANSQENNKQKKISYLIAVFEKTLLYCSSTAATNNTKNNTNNTKNVI